MKRLIKQKKKNFIKHIKQLISGKHRNSSLSIMIVMDIRIKTQLICYYKEDIYTSSSELFASVEAKKY